jgi:hypothetical protein
LCPQPSSLITAERSLPMGSGGRQSPASHRFPPSEEPGEAPRNPPRSGLLLRNPDSATQLFRHALHPDRVSRPRDALPQDGSHRTKGARHGVRETGADVGTISRRLGACPGVHGEPSRSSGQRRRAEAAGLDCRHIRLEACRRDFEKVPLAEKSDVEAAQATDRRASSRPYRR